MTTPRPDDHLDEGMRLSLKTGDHANLAYFLDAMAVLEAAEGIHARVPLLLGAAQGIREVGRSPRLRLLPARPRGRGRGRVRGADATSAPTGTTTPWTSAEDCRPEEAVALALGERAPAG